MLAFVLAALLSSPSAALPDPAQGNVNGLAGRLFWPATMPEKPGEDIRPLTTAEGCDVFVVPLPDEEKELRFPCGKWFVLPAAGPYGLWMEKDGQISPDRSLIQYKPVPFAGRGFPAMAPLVPAGRVSLPSGSSVASDEELRIFSVEQTSRRLFYRRSKSAAPIQMPVGKVVVGRFDRKTNDAIALSLPVRVVAQRMAVATPRVPSSSDVLVILTRPAAVPSTTGRAIAMELHDGESARAADVTVNAFDRIVGIWYGVAGRKATLALRSDVATWRAADVRLMPGKVATIRGELANLPKVSAIINAPAAATLPDELQLVVTRDGLPLRTLSVAPGTNDITTLPPEPLRVSLRIGQWQLHRDVDLSSGEDATVAFDLDPLRISGTVYHGDEAVRAELAFRNDREWVTVRSDDRGRYEATLWWPQVHLVRLTLPGRGVPPFLDGFREILGSGVVDFHVPRTDYRVHVRDATTGQPVAGARVSVGNTWRDAEARERASALHVETDENGLAILPPLQKGELILEVRAERYATTEPMHLTVDDAHHELDVALQPIRTARTLRLLLPGGIVAANAEVWAVDGAMQLLWRGTAESDGTIGVPELPPGSLILSRHPRAAGSVRRANELTDTWALPPRAEALTVVAETTSGTPAANAQVALWLDGVRLSGVPLSFLTSSSPATDAGGRWIGDNLPPAPLQVLAVEHGAVPAMIGGAFDAVARAVPYPRPSRVAARVQQ